MNPIGNQKSSSDNTVGTVPGAGDLLARSIAASSASSLSTATPYSSLRIRTASWSGVRAAGSGWENAVPVASERRRYRQVASWFREADYNFDDPLSARSFSAWRATLASKEDHVEAAADVYRIRTRTASRNILREAELRLRRSDLAPAAASFDFRDRERVDIEPASPPASPSASAAGTTYPAPPTVGTTPEATFRPATPEEEVEVYAALHRLGADLGEPVEVALAGDGRLEVTGYGLDSARQAQIQNEIGAVPSVTYRFRNDAPPPSADATGGRSTTGAAAPAASAGLQALQTRLEKQIGGGRGGFEQLANDALAGADSLMARAHALRRLARQFPPETEARLSPAARAALSAMRRDHAGNLAAIASTLDQRLSPLLAALGASRTHSAAPLSRSWQSAAAQLFESARRADTLLAVMLGGAAGDVPAERLPAEVATVLGQLRSQSSEFRTLPAE